MLKLALGVTQLDRVRFQESALFKRDFVGILHAPSFLSH